MKNPNAGDVNTGKDLFAKHCKSCHGKDGLGDGPKAATLGKSCGDFTAKEFQSQTDGEIFYKITTGRDKMPAFGKTISEDNERWSLVNYLRNSNKLPVRLFTRGPDLILAFTLCFLPS